MAYGLANATTAALSEKGHGRSSERTSSLPVRQRVGAPIATLALAALGIVVFAGEARSQSCPTGSVTVTSITQVEYEDAAAEAGAAACVTPRASGVTVCQQVPGTTETWLVVAQAPEGGADAQSAVELEVTSGFNCLFDATTPFEDTDSRWIRAIAGYQIPEDAPPLDFIAVVQIGPATQTTATVCPLGDGHDGRQCEEQAVFR